MIFLCIGAAIVYGWEGDFRHFIYWTAAAIITASVTF
jgi:hypothetical protein